MIGELVTRFFLGGAIVAAFAVAGEIFKPKTFSGLFGAAPSVALATLGLAFASKGRGYVVESAKAMVVGSVALLVYAATCVAVARRPGVPIGLGAGLAYAVWLAVALLLYVSSERLPFGGP